MRIEKCYSQTDPASEAYVQCVCCFQLLTVDPTLTALGLPPYPALPANTEPAKIEEIRRTVYVGNIPKDCEGEEVMQFFNDNIGEACHAFS